MKAWALKLASACVEGQDHHLVDSAHAAAARSLSRSVPTRAGASSGLPGTLGKVVARVRLEGHRAAGQAAVARLVAQQRQHGLVATVHTVKIANRDGTFWRQSRVRSSENFHLSLCFL